MKKLISLLSVVAVVVTFGATPAFAQAASLPASKFAAELSDTKLVSLSVGDGSWSNPILSTSIKTPNKKDLLIGVSFETALYTQTKVKGNIKTGTTDTSTAKATLKVRVCIDSKGPEDCSGGFPSEVVYDQRVQTLSATLGGVIESCEDNNPADGVIDVKTECIVTDEMIELILDTMAAHHFNFVVKDLPSGTHTVHVQVSIGTMDGTTLNASAMAGVGRGSLTVEEVRAINQDVPGAGIEFVQ